jgi:hypothetical protein
MDHIHPLKCTQLFSILIASRGIKKRNPWGSPVQ